MRSMYAVTYNSLVYELYLLMSIIIPTPLPSFIGWLSGSGSGSTSESATASCKCSISVGFQDGHSSSLVSQSGPCLHIDEVSKVESEMSLVSTSAGFSAEGQ